MEIDKTLGALIILSGVICVCILANTLGDPIKECVCTHELPCDCYVPLLEDTTAHYVEPLNYSLKSKKDLCVEQQKEYCTDSGCTVKNISEFYQKFPDGCFLPGGATCYFPNSTECRPEIAECSDWGEEVTITIH